ncbi:hypothetical protein ACLI1C_12100 [Devosia sp. XGJD_8]|uniref:hypothetical protein n=1 Tax=Devosia sp. XGJD_8 TaxID=3391187 RepID=UPI0039856149
MHNLKVARRTQDRGALVALGMILGAVVLVTAIGLLQRLVVELSIPTQAVDLAARGPKEGYWWPEFSVRDTYAQWAMTAVALVALGISVVGVVLVRFTFIETRRTAEAAISSNETARRLGEAQVRAYVSWDSANRGTFHSTESADIWGFIITPIIKNTGQSPATIRLLYVDMPLVPVEQPIPDVRFDKTGAEVGHELGSGNLFNMSDRYISIEDARSVHLRQQRCFLMGYGEYRDVFWQSDADTRVLRFCFEVTFHTPPDHQPIDQALNGLRLHSVPDYVIEPLGTD